jgi:hypothetical protein
MAPSWRRLFDTGSLTVNTRLLLLPHDEAHRHSSSR